MIYLDNNATTELDPRVFTAMEPYMRQAYGNPASRHHRPGREASAAVERARAQVAATIGADPREIVWTSGATEANNLAILGVAAAEVYAGRRHLVTVRTEHRAVLDPCAYLERAGFAITRLDVDADGLIDLDALDAALRDDTLLVSVMHGNNETGVLQPIEEIARRCRARGVLLHSDAAQTFGKEPIDVTTGPDLLSFCGHKVHGPKGVGGLYLRRRGPRVRCEPVMHGGGHERGLRPGTLNVPGIVGLGAAAALCDAERCTEQPRIRALRDRLERALLDAVPGTVINAGRAPRLAGTSNVSLPGVDAEELIARLPELACSTASACTSATLQPSYVLRALGLDEQRLRGSLRLSLGRFTTAADIDAAVTMIAQVARP